MRFGTGILIVMIFSTAPVIGAELVMFESPECEWCETWHEEVGVIYAKTKEAKRAPLVRIDIDTPRQGALAEIRPVMYTPTFVLMDNGQEIGRILGYPGEDFFWGLLNEMMAKIPAHVKACPVDKQDTESSVTKIC